MRLVGDLGRIKYMTDVTYAAAGVKALIVNDEGKFLVIKEMIKEEYPAWTLPGGRVEEMEHPIEALVREAQEEVGLEVEVQECLGIFWIMNDKKRPGRKQNVYSTFKCAHIGGEVTFDNKMEDEEIFEYRWVTKEEFLAIDEPVAHRSLIELVSTLDL